MTSPLEHEPTFDATREWGAHAPRGLAGAWLRVCHAIPAIPGGRRLALWARHPLKRCFTGPIDVSAWGYRLRLLPRGNLSESRWLFMPRFYDRAERRFWRRHLKQGDTFLDIGGNVGSYSFWAARCVGATGRVISIEPDPVLRERFEFNIALNHLHHVHVESCALGAATGRAKLVLGLDNRGQNTIAPADDASAPADAVEVPVHTLLDVCRQHEVEQIAGLKIDIEGHEYRVMRPFFEEAPRSLHPRYIQFEKCTDQQAESMRTLMDQHRYRRACTGRMNAIYVRMQD